MNGAEMIAAERRRQVESEGWTPEHDDDDDHGACELTMAATSYAVYAIAQVNGSCLEDPEEGIGILGTPADQPPPMWPPMWDAAFWKPSDDPIRNLVKAGALIAAEIDRLQR